MIACPFSASRLLGAAQVACTPAAKSGCWCPVRSPLGCRGGWAGLQVLPSAWRRPLSARPDGVDGDPPLALPGAQEHCLHAVRQGLIRRVAPPIIPDASATRAAKREGARVQRAPSGLPLSLGAETGVPFSGRRRDRFRAAQCPQPKPPAVEGTGFPRRSRHTGPSARRCLRSGRLRPG